MEKTRCPLRLVVIFKNYFFVRLHFSAESVNCSLFLKNLEKTFLQLDLQKKTSKHIENLPQHLSEKFIGDNLSIIDIALRNLDLSIIGIAQGFFEVIDYRYRFSTKKFIVPITAYRYHHRSQYNQKKLSKSLLNSHAHA